MHGGGGPPSLNIKSSSASHSSSSASNQSNASSDPPPPIPARRLASHPPTSSSAKADGSSHHHQHQQGLGVKEKDVSESHSAPSSPTEKGHKDGAKGDESGGSQSTVSPRHSSRSPNYQRPKSVVVDMTSGLNYAQVQFANGHNVGGRPKAAQRRNTKYTSIAYQPENAVDKAKRSSKVDADGHTHGKSEGGQNKGQHAQDHHQQQQARQPTSPPLTTGHHHGHHHASHSSSSPRSSPVPSSGIDNAMYDVPPPVPTRMDLLESNEGGVVGGRDKSSAQEPVHKRHSSDPFHGGATDPFAQDPFGGDSGAGALDDPSAFYDKPPSRQPIPARSDPSATATTTSVSSTQAGVSGGSGGVSTQQLPGGIVIDENATNSADFTGESSYEDTFEVLQNLQKMKSKGGADPYAPASSVFMAQDNKKTEHSHTQLHQQQSRNEMSSPDLNQANKDSYEFPTELAKYPLKSRPEVGQAPATMPIETQPRCKEEPTLHTFNYSPKLPHSSNAPTSSASVTRHESFSRSSRNMPLPPLPTEVSNQQQQQQSPWQPHSVDHAPPLPARTVPNTGGRPPLPGNHPSMRKTAATPASDEQPPRLPPPNHPWGNKRHPGEPADNAGGNPPLPPRKKEGSSGTDMPGAAPPGQQQASRKDELAMRELIALGYSKAEIDRALKITRNDYTMAKMILQEFGGRH